MARPKNEFTNVTSLLPEALGEPGKRTFRVRADSGANSATISLEKEQLLQLAVAVQQLLATMPEDEDASGTPPQDREAPGPTNLEFKVSKLVLGHDGRSGLFMVDAHDEEDEDEETSTVRVWASREQVKDFSEKAIRVCAAGRPLCPLCGRPLDPDGHRCPRVNGTVRPESL